MNDEVKVGAAKLYMQLGNMRAVSDRLDISYSLLYEWRKQEWWGQIIDELRNAEKAQRGNKLSTIIDQSLDVIQDRLEHGDFILNNKTGKVERKPVSIRDAAAISNNLLGRQLQVEELQQKAVTTKETVQDTLTMLAKEFKRFTRSQAVDTPYKEIENAVYDEREERLQEGSSQLHFQAGSEKEEGDAEQGPSNYDESGVGA